MELVPQELCAIVPSMAIVDSEEAALRPDFVFAVRGLGDVQDDGDAVLVVRSHQALVGDRSVGSHDSVPFDGALGRLLVRDDDSSARLQGELLAFSFFVSRHLVDHLLDVKRGQLLDLLLQTGGRVDLDLLGDEARVLLEEGLHVQVGLPDVLWIGEVVIWRESLRILLRLALKILEVEALHCRRELLFGVAFLLLCLRRVS
jgi:hypothetical protein